MDADIRIRDDVIEELDFEPSVDSAAIGVGVKDGVVARLNSRVDGGET